MPTSTPFKAAAAASIAVAQSIAMAGPFPGDTQKDDGSLWYRHSLGNDKHCLLDNPDGLSDTASPSTAAVLYKEAPLSSAQSDQLFIYVEGGGSCNDVKSCTESDKYPKNEGGYPNAVFQAEIKLSTYLYLRTSPLAGDSNRVSPFANMNMAMIPYCTGDSHTGRVIRKEKIKNSDASKTSFCFYGHYNFIAAIDFLLTQQFANSNLKTIWLMGTSAGAGGVAAQYAKLRDKFTAGHPERQIHLIEDSTPSVSIEPDHWDNMATWQTKIPGLPCTPPPTQRPAADSGFAALSTATAVRTRKYNASRTSAQTGVTTFTDTGVSPNSDDYPTGLAYPFPPEGAPEAASARRTFETASFETTDTTLAKPRSDTCYYLNETRVFNRSLDPNFRYGLLSFKWDNVLSPKKTQSAYDLYFSRMSANDLVVKNYYSSPPYNANTQNLYLDNSTQSQAITAEDPQGALCGRHVPTNFKTEQIDIDKTYSQVQDAHFEFISAMVSGISWASNDGLILTRCPREVSDVFPTSF